jgi:hypothetical protein
MTTRVSQSSNVADYRRLELEQLRSSVSAAEAQVRLQRIEADQHAVLQGAWTARADLLRGLVINAEEMGAAAATASARTNELLATAEKHLLQQQMFLKASEAKMQHFVSPESHVAATEEPQRHSTTVPVEEARTVDTPTQRQPRRAPLPHNVSGPACVEHCTGLPWRADARPLTAAHRAETHCTWHPPRTVYGVGKTFLAYVAAQNDALAAQGGSAEAERGWTVVDRPEAASVVWCRDHLVEFESERWDPYRQQLNRNGQNLEQALGNKAELARSMEAYYSRNPGLQRYVPDTFPFSRPEDFLTFITAFKQPRYVALLRNNVWILKRADLASGFGATVVPNVQRWFDAEKLTLMEAVRSGKTFVLQRYIASPMLLDRRKFDTRFYLFLTTSYEPVRALVAEGYVRISVTPYKNADYDNQRIHISNVAQGRTSAEYTELGYDFFVRPLHQPPTAPGDALALPSHHADWARIKANMLEAIRHVLRAIVVERHRELWQPANVFASQLFGCDFTIDSSGHPWLTEVQVCPALGIEADAGALFMETLELLYERLRKRMAGGESLELFRCDLKRFENLDGL